MTGTLRITENGSHTWVKGTTLAHTVEKFEKLGDVRVRGAKISVRRWCGGLIKAQFFPSKT